MSSSLAPYSQTITGTFATNGAQSFAGTVNGNVHFGSTGLHPASAPEPDPKPLSTNPFRRDPDFVDRGLLSQVESRCSLPAGRAALVGLGGVGKSQVAIEYTYHTRDLTANQWIFWVHASNAARFEQAFQEIADVVKLPGREDSKSNIFKLVHDWLRASEDKWLLVLDNVDDAGFLTKTPQTSGGQSSDSNGQARRPLREYLPQSPNGSVLVTARNREAALELVEANDIIQVEPMVVKDAVKLLEKKLESSLLKSQVCNTALVVALECMPLAIVQAAAYISRRAPRCSVEQYIEEFQRSDRKASSLLNYEGGQLRRDGEAKNSIIISWQISFEHIHDARPSAADLLSLMSFYDPQGIPEELLRSKPNAVDYNNAYGERDEQEFSDGSEHELSDDDAFEADVQTLRDFSFISLSADPTTFEMHKLVQLATRTWLAANHHFTYWRQRSVENLDSKCPTGAFENWRKCALYFPHVRMASAQRSIEDNPFQQWASLLYKGAWYSWQRRDMSSTLEMSLKSWKAREELLGLENEATIESMGMLGHAYDISGQWREAERIRLQAMETSKRVLGQDHPTTLSSINNLALTNMNQGLWTKAEQLQIQGIEACKRVLGQDHPDTINSMNNLALTYMNQGRWTETEQLQVQGIEACKKVLGQDHPDTLSSMGNLAVTYMNQGRWTEAEALQVQVTETRTKVLGQDHPDTLDSMDDLAYNWKETGKEEAAIKLLKECIQHRKHVLGTNHQSTMESENVLADWLREET